MAQPVPTDTPNPARDAAIAELHAITTKIIDRCLPFIKSSFDKIEDSDCILGDFRKGISDWLMLISVPKQNTPIPAQFKLGKGAKMVDFIFLLNDGGMEGQLALHPQPDGSINYDFVVTVPVPVASEAFRAYLGIFSAVSDHPAHQVPGCK